MQQQQKTTSITAYQQALQHTLQHTNEIIIMSIYSIYTYYISMRKAWKTKNGNIYWTTYIVNHTWWNVVSLFRINRGESRCGIPLPIPPSYPPSIERKSYEGKTGKIDICFQRSFCLFCFPLCCISKKKWDKKPKTISHVGKQIDQELQLNVNVLKFNANKINKEKKKKHECDLIGTLIASDFQCRISQ